jgi:hypothetical protein
MHLPRGDEVRSPGHPAHLGAVHALQLREGHRPARANGELGFPSAIHVFLFVHEISFTKSTLDAECTLSTISYNTPSRQTLCDIGDVFTIPANIEKSFDQISNAVAHIASNGTMPIILGG